MESVTDTERSLSVSVYLDEKTGTWRYRRTAYYANGVSKRINGSAEKWNNTKSRAEQLEAAEYLRISTLLPGQEDQTQHTADEAPVKPPVPTLAESHGAYLDAERLANRGSYYGSKEGHFRNYLVPILGHKRIDEIDYAVIEDLKVELSKRQALNTKHFEKLLGPATINNIVVSLSDFLEWERKRGAIESVPEIEWLKVPPQSFDFLDFHEAPRFVAGADGDWGDMFLIDIKTGMRVGELIGVWKEDVDLHTAMLRVTRSLVEGKLGPTKSGKTRYIPLSDDACAAFDRQMGRVPGPYVFGLPDGSPLTDGRLARPFQRALKRSGIGRHITPHDLRHTFASHLVMRNAPLKAVQEMMGHANISMTMRYAHLAPHVTRDAVRLLDQAPPVQNSVRFVRPNPGIHVEVATNWQDGPSDGLTN